MTFRLIAIRAVIVVAGLLTAPSARAECILLSAKDVLERKAHELVFQQDPVARWDCGEPRADIDEQVQNRIESELTGHVPRWEVRTDLAASQHDSRLLQVSRDGLRAGIGIHYSLTTEDAAKYLKCQFLKFEAQPPYKAVSGIGDEAYVFSSSRTTSWSGLWFRANNVVFILESNDEHSLETEREIARRLLNAVTPR